MASQENNSTFIETRAGIKPSQEALPYTIATNTAEAYLQKKLDTVLRKAGKEPIPLTLSTFATGERFFPFVMTLPTKALRDDQPTKKSVNSIFLSNSGYERRRQLQPNIWETLKGYTYSKRDANAFRSEAWKRDMKIQSRSIINRLLQLKSPCVMTFEKDGPKYVVLLIDPLRVFHDMLKSKGPNDNRHFVVDVDSVKKLNTGNFQYNITRVIDKDRKKKNTKDQLDAILRQRNS